MNAISNTYGTCALSKSNVAPKLTELIVYRVSVVLYSFACIKSVIPCGAITVVISCFINNGCKIIRSCIYRVYSMSFQSCLFYNIDEYHAVTINRSLFAATCDTKWSVFPSITSNMHAVPNRGTLDLCILPSLSQKCNMPPYDGFQSFVNDSVSAMSPFPIS